MREWELDEEIVKWTKLYM